MIRVIGVPGDGQYILPPRPFSRFVFYAGAMSLGTFEETRPKGGFLRFLCFSREVAFADVCVVQRSRSRCMRGRLRYAARSLRTLHERAFVLCNGPEAVA